MQDRRDCCHQAEVPGGPCPQVRDFGIGKFNVVVPANNFADDGAGNRDGINRNSVHGRRQQTLEITITTV